MDRFNKLKEDALNYNLIIHDYDVDAFNEKAIKSAEEAGFKEVYNPEYDKQQDLDFGESIQKLKDLL